MASIRGRALTVVVVEDVVVVITEGIDRRRVIWATLEDDDYKYVYARRRARVSACARVCRAFARVKVRKKGA